MLIIGLTGGIGCGKSVVSQFFRELGAYIIDWDELSRDIVLPHHEAWQEIVDYFGKDVLYDDLTLNREELGKIVFGDTEKLKKLEAITHPRIAFEDFHRVKQISEVDPDAIIIKEVPLLVEVGGHHFVDRVVVVSVNKETQMRRLVERGLPEEEAKKRIASQSSQEEKVKVAHFVIHNDGSLQETKQQVERVYKELQIFSQGNSREDNLHSK